VPGGETISTRNPGKRAAVAVIASAIHAFGLMPCDRFENTNPTLLPDAAPPLARHRNACRRTGTMSCPDGPCRPVPEWCSCHRYESVPPARTLLYTWAVIVAPEVVTSIAHEFANRPDALGLVRTNRFRRN